jgi:hypothetical protein
MKFLIIIGAYKAGTTSLFNYLSEHPEICPCTYKEPNFFCDDDKYRMGNDYYRSLWEWNADDHVYAMEASQSYTWYPILPNAAERMRDSGGEIKLIYILRDPVKRIESQITYMTTMCLDNLYSEDSEIHEHHLILSNYYRQLAEYERFIGRDNIFLVDFDDLKNDSEKLLSRIVAFLDLEEFRFQSSVAIHNKTRGKVVPGKLWRFLRKSSVLKMMANSLPIDLKMRMRASLGDVVQENLRLNESQRAFVMDSLRDDFERLRDEYGVDITKWGF